MILRQISLSNFGIYRGDFTFDLAPVSSDMFSRPIVFFAGKNGVGKTTLSEAIRLGLYGALAIADRVGQKEYREYLLGRIHRSTTGGLLPDRASICLLFDHVALGRKVTYEIQRVWIENEGKLEHSLRVLEDGHEPADVAADQYEAFLRELVPPGLADMFFFDGERIRLLSEESTASQMVAEAIRALLGLNQIEQLQKDLDIYSSRELAKSGAMDLTAELEQVERQSQQAINKKGAVHSELTQVVSQVAEARRFVTECEQRLSEQGAWFSSRLADLKGQEHALELALETQRKRVQELCSGLMPFAIAQQPCQWVSDRLRREEQYRQQRIAQSLLDEQVGLLTERMRSPDFWLETELIDREEAQRTLLLKVTNALKDSVQAPEVDPSEILLDLSEREHDTLSNWIVQAASTVQREFSDAVTTLVDLERSLKEARHALVMAPPEEALQALVTELGQLHSKLSLLQRRQRELEEEERSVDYELQQIVYHRQRARQSLDEKRSVHERLRLASKTQLALNEYAEIVGSQKLRQFESMLLQRFNELCRKDSFLEKVAVDPETFAIRLYRVGQLFDREQLSAGEKQLLAVATMWALRDVSGLPIPVIMDTPLGRLDTDHRLTIVRQYLPHASHQVIMFATDAEVDRHLFSEIAPLVARSYRLEFDSAQGTTVVVEAIDGAEFPF